MGVASRLKNWVQGRKVEQEQPLGELLFFACPHCSFVSTLAYKSDMDPILTEASRRVTEEGACLKELWPGVLKALGVSNTSHVLQDIAEAAFAQVRGEGLVS